MTEDEMIQRGTELFQQCYNGVIPTPKHIDSQAYRECLFQEYRALK